MSISNKIVSVLLLRVNISIKGLNRTKTDAGRASLFCKNKTTLFFNIIFRFKKARSQGRLRAAPEIKSNNVSLLVFNP